MSLSPKKTVKEAHYRLMPNKRGERRLEIARGLLSYAGLDTLAYIRSLPKDRQDRIRELVDWVEDYESYDPLKALKLG